MLKTSRKLSIYKIIAEHNYLQLGKLETNISKLKVSFEDQSHCQSLPEIKVLYKEETLLVSCREAIDQMSMEEI